MSWRCYTITPPYHPVQVICGVIYSPLCDCIPTTLMQLMNSNNYKLYHFHTLTTTILLLSRTDTNLPGNFFFFNISCHTHHLEWPNYIYMKKSIRNSNHFILVKEKDESLLSIEKCIVVDKQNNEKELVMSFTKGKIAR